MTLKCVFSESWRRLNHSLLHPSSSPHPHHPHHRHRPHPHEQRAVHRPREVHHRVQLQTGAALHLQTQPGRGGALQRAPQRAAGYGERRLAQPSGRSRNLEDPHVLPPAVRVLRPKETSIFSPLFAASCLKKVAFFRVRLHILGGQLGGAVVNQLGRRGISSLCDIRKGRPPELAF